jgi:hypothetical protein
VIAALLTTLAFLVVTAPVPLTGDQALFLTAGRDLVDGHVLYRDFWDIKQPGIFWWYAVAHLLPGPDGLGVRLLEGAWQLGTVILVLMAARSAVRTQWVVWVTPVLVLGPYLATGGQRGWALGLVEPLLALPLLAVLLLLHRGCPLGPPACVLGGAGSGRRRRRAAQGAVPRRPAGRCARCLPGPACDG